MLLDQRGIASPQLRFGLKGEMPTPCIIRIFLVSQFDLLTIPEYGITEAVGCHWVIKGSDQMPAACLTGSLPVITGFVPAYLGSQLLVRYDVSLPGP